MKRRPYIDDDTRDIGRGPLNFNVDMARVHGWSDGQINAAWGLLVRVLAVFQWWIAFRAGYRRRCRWCENYTFKGQRCHVCGEAA